MTKLNSQDCGVVVIVGGQVEILTVNNAGSALISASSADLLNAGLLAACYHHFNPQSELASAEALGFTQVSVLNRRSYSQYDQRMKGMGLEKYVLLTEGDYKAMILALNQSRVHALPLKIVAPPATATP